jgi:hypothetical protein
MVKLKAILSFVFIPILLNGQELDKSFNKAIKVTPFTYFFNHIALTLEHSPKLNRSMEYTLGLIGLNNHNEYIEYYNYKYIKKQKGAYAKVGYKYIFENGLNLGGQYLTGSYFKLESGVSLYNESHFYSIGRPSVIVEEYENNFYSINMMVGLGQQFIVFKRIALNGYALIGPNFSNLLLIGSLNNVPVAPFNSAIVGYESRFSYTLGFNVGYTFK